ncbi:serine/threonine-protein kinase ULK3-like [Pyrus ussuriensis x Pyrus communis]|uniref:Serine/threonine-protein kinase ULK3-like n=1 Tax=Pyrus ussuriensis x Pyrus communis TaxID=2448454 RepID=A0A5N5GJ02_9ROSA|nr:serine/threonine-protein kinase ULK3-like [Pyrus ussuriensis x Pyrus communis]
MESIKNGSVMVNSFSHYLESSLPLNSTTGASISAPKQNDCDKPIIMKTEEQPASSVGAESSQTSGSAKLPTSCESTQLLEGKYNAKLFFDSFLVQLVVLAIWEKSIQIAAYEFRGSYVFRLCNVGGIFDIQVGYHMGICDKGGGTRSMLIWLLWYT